MNMPGGGVFNLNPGQFTDDTEMAFHLMRALSNFDPKAKLE
jgi:ADP-ribosylglycohydrolase